jgi:hypothetical protein
MDSMPTSHVRNAQHSDGTRLNDTALVGQKRRGTSRDRRGTVLEIAWVGVGSRLEVVVSHVH